MSFAENLKLIRKERNLSQEELAEILEVIRQAISKWEQGDGYPEVEKLLLLSSKLNISLDNLMSTKFAQKSSNNQRMEAGLITITSPYENVIVTCHKVMASGKMAGGKLSPKYALFGANNGIDIFGGESRTFLGWYANEDEISKEIKEIHNAIISGIATYTLKYSVKTKKRLAGIKIEIE